jgi:hypothetical protein
VPKCYQDSLSSDSSVQSIEIISNDIPSCYEENLVENEESNENNEN